MKRKKILFYTMTLIKGGTERTIANLSNHLIKDYDITIVTNIKSKIEYKLNPNIKVIRIDNKDKSKEIKIKKLITKTSSKRQKKLTQIIKTENPNLIISFLPEPTIRALKLKTNIPVIATVRNHPNSEFKSIFKIIRNKYYKKAKKIIIQDDKFKKYFPNHLKNKIITIPNYISDEFLTKNNQKKGKTIITVSRLEKQKNLKFLIKTYSKLKTKDYKLIIYGKGSQKTKLQKLIKKLKEEKNIVIKNPVDNIKEKLDKAYIFILPSNYEGMPNVLLEAMSRSLPVITTNCSEIIETIITNNKNGIIIQKNNQKQLIENIETLIQDKTKYHQISKEALKIRDIYNKKNIITKWENVIKKHIKN